MALGALQGSVLWLVMKEVAWMTGIGLLIGLPLAFGAARLIEKLLYGVQARDFAIFAGATLALAFVAALAGFIPARRATTIDPIRALRYE
jgi:ABC-type antimicrobial peptide transport system permease subunit